MVNTSPINPTVPENHDPANKQALSLRRDPFLFQYFKEGNLTSLSSKVLNIQLLTFFNVRKILVVS